MDQTGILGNLTQLSVLEQILAYLHRNHLPLSAEALALHAGQIQAELGLAELPPDALKYIRQQEWNYREADVLEHYLKDSRIGIFFHPRFAPINVHSHHYFEIKYLLSGHAELLVEGRTLSLTAGDLVFLAPQVEHVVNIYDRESLLVNLVITPDAASSAFPRVYFSDNPLSSFFSAALPNHTGPSILLCRTGGDEAIRDLVLAAYHRRGGGGSVPGCLLLESITEQLLLEVLADHIRDFDCTESPSSLPDKLFPILGYIHDHCATASLEELSRVFSYSPAHLSRLIRQYTGKTFSTLLRSARLSQASRLLTVSDLPIQDVMLRTGYTGKAHFYRVFQEAFGMTPAQFRRQNTRP